MSGTSRSSVKYLLPLVLSLGACGVKDTHARGTIEGSEHFRFPNFVELTVATDGVPFEWETSSALQRNSAPIPCANLRLKFPTGDVVASDCGVDPWTLLIGGRTYEGAALLLKSDGTVSVLYR